MLPAVLAAAGSSGLLGGLFGLVDKLFTSDEERADVKRKLVELEQQGQLAQIAVNMEEAKHESIFVSGWRPAIGWICGAALAWTFIVQPFATWALVVFVPDFPTGNLPDLDMGPLLTILGGMLGLAGLRTYEKRTGTNRNRAGATVVPPASGGAFRSIR